MLGGDLLMFSNVPSVIIVLGLTVFLGITSFGWKTFRDGFRALWIVYQNQVPSWVGPQHLRVIRAMRRHFLVSGFLGTVIGLVQMLASLSDPASIGPAMAVAMLTVLYGLFFSLFLCQPALSHLAGHFASPPEETIVPTLETETKIPLSHSSSSKRIWATVAVVAIVAFFVERGLLPETERGETSGMTDPETMIGPIYRFDPFVGNLADSEPSKGIRYLKTTIAIELDSGYLIAEVERREDQIRDIFLSLLGDQTSKDLMSSKGKFILRGKLLQRVNALLVNGKVRRIFFRDFTIQ